MTSAPVERTCAIVGRGRAGRAFASALRSVGWSVELLPARSLPSPDDRGTRSVLEVAALILLAVPDHAIGAVARGIEPVDGVVAHVSGATGLDVLRSHGRVGSLHPLMSLPDAEVGARRLLDRCTFAVAGDALMSRVVDDLGGRAVTVDDSTRPLYHATASIAANHLVALCAQVERLATEVGVPVDAYLRLMTTTLDNVLDVGAASALTGPAARADWTTVRSHLDALTDDRERVLYRALCVEAAALAGHELPAALLTDA